MCHRNSNVRLLLGYQRIEDPQLVPKINELYRAWALFNNFFCTNLKLIQKTKVGSRYQKKYDAPKTSHQRLMESEHLNEAQKTLLTEIYCNLNPFSLKKQIDYKQRQILSTLSVTSNYGATRRPTPGASYFFASPCSSQLSEIRAK